MGVLDNVSGLNATHLDFAQSPQVAQLMPTTSMLSVSITSGIALALYFAISWITQPKLVTNAYYVGYRSWFEPTWLLRLRWSWDARKILKMGYYQSKETPFVVRRWDRDITILPQKNLNDIRAIPNTKLNAQIINIFNQAAEYTGLTFIANNNLLFRALTNKLTADLPRFMDSSRDVLEWAAPLELPQSTEWTETEIEHATRMIFARLSSNMVLGPEAPKDVAWCHMAASVSFNTMTCGLVLKKLPSWLRPVVAPLLPLVYKIRASHARSSELITPILERWKSGQPRAEDKDTLLYWMLENAREDEKTPMEMAFRANALILASVHTNGMTLTSVLFNLCGYPQYIDMLREEIAEVTKELGPMGAAGPETLQRQWLAKLEKMDSFIAESLRVNQPILFAPNRMAMEDITLKDGTVIPKGTWIAFPSAEIMMDPDYYPDPETFDGLRNYRKRRALSDAGNKHLSTQPSLSDLSFGHGNRTCPGRFFAVSALKMVLSKILTEYDIKYAGETDPYNKMEEFSFISMDAKIMMKKRDGVA